MDGAPPWKVYVEVKVEFRPDGVMLPREIIWEDGARYEIDRVKRVDAAAARRAGGCGDRYTVQVRGRETYLFFERSPDRSGGRLGRWFVERRSA